MNQTIQSTRVAITRDVRGFSDQLDVYLWKRVGDGSVVIFEPVVLRRLTPEEAAASQCMERRATLTIDKDAARALMDELWALGVRPSNGEGSVGEIAAVRAHLGDMQRLVFKEKRP